jgi:hypothetical protein
VAVGQAHVEEDYVGVCGRDSCEGFGDGGGFADDLDVLTVEAKQGAEAYADELAVVDEGEADGRGGGRFGVLAHGIHG